ncbi:MAG: polysaccharide deacetylase family protein [Bacteroidetes bacterium]|nr:polysaccharide deacetylase family protein [Bacteroidota bacterium]
MKTRSTLCFLLLALSFTQRCWAQTGPTVFKWPNGARAAICLTFDDALSSQIKVAVPLLNRYKLKATFFPTIASGSFREDVSRWKAVAKQNHEIGNHSLYHPCQKSAPGMDWVAPYHDLDTYSIQQFMEELSIADVVIQLMGGRKNRTFAYPCSHFMIGGVDVTDSIRHHYLSARDSDETMPRNIVPVDQLDLHHIPSWAPSGNSAQELIGYVELVKGAGLLGVFTFHGIGGDHMTTETSDFEQLLQYLVDNRKSVWVTTFEEASEYIQRHRASLNPR